MSAILLETMLNYKIELALWSKRNIQMWGYLFYFALLNNGRRT